MHLSVNMIRPLLNESKVRICECVKNTRTNTVLILGRRRVTFRVSRSILKAKESSRGRGKQEMERGQSTEWYSADTTRVPFQKTSRHCLLTPRQEEDRECKPFNGLGSFLPSPLQEYARPECATRSSVK